VVPAHSGDEVELRVRPERFGRDRLSWLCRLGRFPSAGETLIRMRLSRPGERTHAPAAVRALTPADEPSRRPGLKYIPRHDTRGLRRRHRPRWTPGIGLGPGTGGSRIVCPPARLCERRHPCPDRAVRLGSSGDDVVSVLGVVPSSSASSQLSDGWRDRRRSARNRTLMPLSGRTHMPMSGRTMTPLHKSSSSL